METNSKISKRMKEACQKLTDDELYRHAEISLWNKCFYGVCFCCAALEELKKRKKGARWNQ